MKTSPSSSKPVNLSDSLYQHLHMYALAASAAGVSLLAMAQPGEAEIVYTPAHKHLTPGHTIRLDLDGDGNVDFKIHNSFTCTSFCEYIVGAITVKPAQSGNEIWGYAGRSNLSFASALRPGAVISSQGNFSPNNNVMATGGYDAGTTTKGWCFGPWKDKRNRYLGLKFTINGEVHYGWARLTESCSKSGENTAYLTGYGYETVPNMDIKAGRTRGKDEAVTGSVAPVPHGTPAQATLGLLAKGVSALSIWRRD